MAAGWFTRRPERSRLRPLIESADGAKAARHIIYDLAGHSGRTSWPGKAQDPHRFFVLEEVESADYSAVALSVIMRDPYAAERPTGEWLLARGYAGIAERKTLNFPANHIVE